MNGTTTDSLLITVVAVLGTLVSALLAQRQAHRAMATELARLERRSSIESYRASYTALNTAARRYVAALTDQLHALRADGDHSAVAATTKELHRARATHADCYAEIQVTAPPAVLAAAQEVNHDLNATYGLLLRLTHATAAPGETPATAQTRITTLWETTLPTLRTAMRHDLHLTPDHPPSRGLRRR
ncbi:hypothetical protein RM844_22195 [Streptomyces sp. DSM 44915]|uniref:Secreted protein n=1 Tax=Streptomyces chisholmiae TaxID=3075540 RepID=A0ABU2JVN5_9ACTN|nr:hypothetical protein [Streptomyces sp. DSM 44915]MDT0269000.1 hypothetical protein [Streptomyces sp. DSM 44915]